MTRSRSSSFRVPFCLVGFLVLVAGFIAAVAPCAAGTVPSELTLTLRTQDAKTHEPIITSAKIDPKKVGIVIVDPWNYHWCMTLAARVASVAPLYNQAFESARQMGMQIFWAPSEPTSMYAGTPARERVATIPLVEVPKVREFSCKFTGNWSCECGPGIACNFHFGLDGIAPGYEIKDEDWIVTGSEAYSICKAKGLTHLLMVGFATNACLYARPSGIVPMMSAGMNCILVRDMTDAVSEYRPADNYTPDEGTAQAVADLERAGLPSISLVDELRKVGLWQEERPVHPVNITPWGIEDRPYLFDGSVNVSLTDPWEDGAEIFYTLDGTEPTLESMRYAKQIILEKTTHIRAAAFRGGRRVSLISDGHFVRLGAMPPQPDVYLDQVQAVTEYPCWYASWHPVTNKSFENKALLLRGKHYKKGLGMRAPSNMRYPLKGEYDRFVCLAGIDGNLLRAGKDRYGVFPGGQGRSSRGGAGRGSLLAQQPSVQFRIFIDGKQAAESAKLKIGQGPWRFDVKIPEGARQINLTVVDNGRRSVLNLANWVDAGFVLKK